jgi:hypothetical protein
MLCPSYYCLYSLVNKIKDKGKNSFCLEARGWGEEGRGKGKGKGWRDGERNDPNIVCTYE